ncbi:hypothetical protein A2899_00945 [Candidatus Amesbacteria bacterium RIFCSPLOWO2_01_FULL_49_25]|uniref:Phage holin family protein n=1 Tax=Candidatus Amesbacteria bacterium RIFCSPHIGHO2_01_FULL_48_32b TaxID=1797253 RepID=A0A1F4YFU1_9BACT|nr:MAG: hypothetical protein A2876_00095 [Candidatus Amesbacteria bacterium RIFCSPHIGHO2_01_FULL_48_32b]OGD07133.1 MAG: hypothetical protein A2899_00945 [Candidatus Amesbacteria bacterium RIFCSPLOWO2_01_FULL_49_25]
MFRLFFRSIAINLASVYLAAQVLSGVITYVGGWQTLFLAALAISLVNLFVRPVVNLLLLPIHLITMGIFRWVANIITLYIVTWIIPNIQIHAFISPGINLKYLIVPPIQFTVFGAFLVSTFALTLIFHFLYWLLQD